MAYLEIFYGGGCKQIVKISIHGVSKEPKDTNTLNNNKKKILRP